jgi:hypothetical protein
VTIGDLPLLEGFSRLKEIEVIKLVLWWCHQHDGKEWIQGEGIRACYARMHRATPAGGFTAYLKSLVERRPPQVIQTRHGYKLEQRTAQALSEKYGRRETALRVEKLLLDLPSTLPNLQERAYLEEALVCFRHGAFRASVVMAWNLAFDHLCSWIVSDAKRLADFNARVPVRYAKEKYPAVTKRDDFVEMKESHIIDIADSAYVITSNVAKVLREKIIRRNMAAHPADVSTLQPTAEEFIRDLVENVVLNLE